MGLDGTGWDRMGRGSPSNQSVRAASRGSRLHEQDVSLTHGTTWQRGSEKSEDLDNPLDPN